jgi:hypothetical protein
MNSPVADGWLTSSGAQRLRTVASLLIAAPMLLGAPQRSQACASCGCTLSADAAMGYSALPGWRLSIEYDYINQDQLRSGTNTVTGVPAGST